MRVFMHQGIWLRRWRLHSGQGALADEIRAETLGPWPSCKSNAEQTGPHSHSLCLFSLRLCDACSCQAVMPRLRELWLSLNSGQSKCR